MKTIKVFHREFTNYSGFEKYNEVLFMDSLANMVQEYLYTSRDDNEPRGYRLDGIIKLYDFMSLEIFFVKSMLHSLGKAAIKGYIDDLCQSRYTYEHNLVIEYENNEQDLLVCNASDKLIIPLLWTAYIYANTRYLVEKDEDFKNATSMLYDLMMEKSYYDKEYTKQLPPLKYSKEAIEMLATHIGKKYNETVKKQTENVSPPKGKAEESNDALEQLKAELAASNDRVSELESENEELRAFKQEIAELEAQLNVQEQNISDKRKQKLTEEEKQLEKEQEITRLKNDLEAFKTQNGKNRMTASQAAILLLTVCHNLGKLPNDKKKLTPVLEQGWGFTETTASRALGSKPSQDVADETASIFESVSPKLARLIKEFPQTFETIRLSKLKANNDKKVKKQ